MSEARRGKDAENHRAAKRGRGKQRAGRGSWRWVPRLEALEDRLLPSGVPQFLKALNADMRLNSMVQVNGTAFFAANDGTHGFELWRSGGTVAGTQMVKDIDPGSGSSYPRGLTNVGGTLFFSANDGTHGYELWRSDGAAAGTQMVADIGYPVVLTNFGGTLFFTVFGTDGGGLWRSNGSAAGTQMVKNISSVEMTNVDGTLFLSADDATGGLELWRSDGTGAGTQMITDINLGSPGVPASILLT